MRLLTAGSSVRARQGEPNTFRVYNLLREEFSEQIIWKSGPLAQLVEQWSPKPRAEGSNPSAPARYADVAQVVAHILGKDEVTSSSLVISSNRKTSKNCFAKLFLDVFFLRSDLI